MTQGQAHRLRKLTARLAQINPGDRVQDVGCGTGSVTLPTKKLAGEGEQVAGIDPSAEMIWKFFQV